MQRLTRIPRLATNYVILSGAEFISKIMAAVALAYLARVLGPQSYGYLEFAIAIYFIFTLIVDSGLSFYGARELAKNDVLLPRLFVHITLIRSILSLLAFIVMALVARFIDQPQSVKVLILLYGLVMFIVPWLIQWVFQGRDMMRFVGLSQLLRWSVFTVAVLLLVREPNQVWYVPLIEGLALLCVALFLLGALLRNFGFPRYRINSREAFGMFRQALPIGASEVVWAVKVYFATILLGFVIGGPELGWFTSAHRVVIALHTFVWLYFYNMLPSIARTSQQPITVLQKLMRVSIQITAWAGLLLGIYGVVYAEVGITFIFGVQFQEAGRVFQVLVWLIPLALMSGHFRYTLIGYNLQKLEFYSALVGAAVTVVLNLILVPRLGMMGAAWALVISEVVIWLVAYYFVRRTIAVIPVFRNIWRPMIAGIALTAVLFFLMQVNIWLAGVVGLIFYSLLFVFAQPNLFNSLRTIYSKDQ